MSTQLHNSDSFLRRVEMHQRLAPTIILHYNPTLRELEVWFWYVLAHLRYSTPEG
jgi:hypothetical protein